MCREVVMYRYLGCGLDNILLRNGYELRKTASGVDVVAIQDVAGLHRVIALNVCERTRPLTSKEFRFIRKELDMSQRQVALLMGVEEQTVSLWERGSPINAASDMLLRSLMKEHLSGNPEIKALMDRFCALDREARSGETQTDLEFEACPDWRLAA